MSDTISLLNTDIFPPRGWTYREPSLNWTNPDPLNGEGIEHAIRLLQTVRAQNPASNLDPSYEACREAIVQFTCARLHYDPRWCGLPPLEQQAISERAYAQAGRKCAGCGRR